MILIDSPSCQSLLIEMRNEHAGLATGTAFVVEHDGTYFLITNRHNLTGRRQDNNQPLHPSGAVPDRVHILHNYAGKTGQWIMRDEPLYSDDGIPLWCEHPTLAAGADVVALRLTNLDEVACYPYGVSGPTGHDAAGLPQPVKIGPSDFVNIIGFPFGWTAGGAFGICVQGAIASEPDIDFGDEPRFLVDSRTRPGQSGSPVVVYKRAGWVTLADGRPYMVHNPLTILLGVYSGRLSTESDLGSVWKTSVVRDIVDGAGPGVPAEKPRPRA